MTEQTPQDETREEEKPEPRDAAYWARYAETLKVAGVDMTPPAPVEAAFEVLAGYVDRLEKLVG